MSKPDNKQGYWQTDSGCFHCGLPIPKNSQYKVSIQGADRGMCCPGCQAVSTAIVDAGMEDYYQYRTEPAGQGRELVPDFLQQTLAYDLDAVQDSFVRHRDSENGKRREADLILEGITCAACIWLNERHIASLDGVTSVAVNYSTHRARIEWDNEKIKLSHILEAITRIGYLAHPYDPSRQQQLLEDERKQQLRRLGLAGVLGMQVMMIAVALYLGDHFGMEAQFEKFFHWISLGLTLPVMLYSAQPFFRTAIRDLKHGQAGMDVPVSIGISVAFAGSIWSTFNGHGEVYYDSVVMFVFFLLTGRYFELVARKKSSESADALVHGVPAVAMRINEAGESLVTVAELKVGDIVRVKPGETFPADGTVIEGCSSVDESLLTGESIPVPVALNGSVIGGAINVESPLQVKVERVGQDTVLSGVLRLLERAQTEKPRITKLADKTAAWFVLVVLVLAGSVATYWWSDGVATWLPITIAILVVTCPCALSLATPTAVTAATSRLTSQGLLTTRGHALETLAKASHFVFDKTGTLTEGKLELITTKRLSAASEEQCIKWASALEVSSEHPIAKALRKINEHNDVVAEKVINKPGAGLMGKIDGHTFFIGTPNYITKETGLSVAEKELQTLREEGHTVVVLADDTQCHALFALGDKLRNDATQLISQLKKSGHKVLLLSGDHSQTVQRVAEQVGIGHWQSDCLPEDKLSFVKDLQNRGSIVAMVGDGINDAPVLAAAQVSIAMASGTQLAAASADMLLLSNELSAISEGRNTAQRMLSIIRQNLTWAIAYNVIALPAAVMGYVAPWMAAIGMSASSLIVVGNALRLLRKSSH